MKYFITLLLLNLKNQLSFGKDSMLWLTVRLLNTIIGLFVIVLVFRSNNKLEGFSRIECILIFSLYTMSIDLFYSFFSWTLWYSRKYVLDGALSEVIRLPVNPLVYIIGSNFALSELFGFLNGAIIFIYSIFSLNLNFTTVLFLLLFFIIGTMGIIGIFLTISSLSCLFPKLEEAFSSLMTLFDFAQYPITIYSNSIRVFLTYIFPIAMIAFYPTAFSLRKIDFESKFVLIPLYSLLIFIIGYTLFIKSVRKYEGSGN